MNIKNFKLRFTFIFAYLILLISLLFINQGIAGQVTEIDHLEDTPSSATKIEISTSEPVEATSYYSSDIIPRLVVEFQTRNISSDIGDEISVNEGPVRKIISNYSGKGQGRSLKSLTFELFQKAPYKILQEENTITLTLQMLPEALTSFSAEDEQSEISEAEVKRLQLMDETLAQIREAQAPSKIFQLEAKDQAKEEFNNPGGEIILQQSEVMPAKAKSFIAAAAFWPMGLILACGLGFLLLYRYKSVTEKEIAKLKADLQKKEKALKHEEIIRKTIETTSLQIENENQQLKKKLHESAEEPQIFQQLKEKRQSSRLDLCRDYTRTVILRIKLQDKDRDIKAFADNISIGGLCFQARKEFKKEERISLRLFFFGHRVPMIKTQVHIVWQKTMPPINYYGVSFDRLNKKDEIELSRYIESKIVKQTAS